MTTLYQFSAQIGSRPAPLILLLTKKCKDEDALVVFRQHLKRSHDLDKYIPSTTVKYTMNAMSSALSTNKVIDTSNDLMNIFPKYLFKVKTCTTTIEKLLSLPTIPASSKPPTAAKPPAPKKPLTQPIEKVGSVVNKVSKDIKKILS